MFPVRRSIRPAAAAARSLLGGRTLALITPIRAHTRLAAPLSRGDAPSPLIPPAVARPRTPLRMTPELRAALRPFFTGTGTGPMGNPGAWDNTSNRAGPRFSAGYGDGPRYSNPGFGSGPHNEIPRPSDGRPRSIGDYFPLFMFIAMTALMFFSSRNDASGRTKEGQYRAFEAAILDGDMTALGLLLQRGYDPNVRNSYGLTPLLLAATFSCHPPAVVALLRAGADPNAPTIGGATVLTALGAKAAVSPQARHQAAAPLHPAVAQQLVAALLAAGADPNLGYTTPPTAPPNGYLPGAGADGGAAPAHGGGYGSRDGGGLWGMLKGALSPDPASWSFSIVKPWGFVICQQPESIAACAAAAGADAELEAEAGSVPHRGAAPGAGGFAAGRRGAGLPPLPADSLFPTPLHAFVRAGSKYVGAIETLAKAGADAGVRDAGGRSAVDVAAEAGDRAVIEAVARAQQGGIGGTGEARAAGSSFSSSSGSGSGSKSVVKKWRADEVPEADIVDLDEEARRVREERSRLAGLDDIKGTNVPGQAASGAKPGLSRTSSYGYTGSSTSRSSTAGSGASSSGGGYRSTPTVDTPLMTAIRRRDVSEVRRLIMEGANVNEAVTVGTAGSGGGVAGEGGALSPLGLAMSLNGTLVKDESRSNDNSGEWGDNKGGFLSRLFGSGLGSDGTRSGAGSGRRSGRESGLDEIERLLVASGGALTIDEAMHGNATSAATSTGSSSSSRFSGTRKWGMADTHARAQAGGGALSGLGQGGRLQKRDNDEDDIFSDGEEPPKQQQKKW